MLKVRLILAVMAIAGIIAPAAARTAAEIFTTAPDRVVRLIPQSRRLDMLDYFRYGSTNGVKNILGGDSRIVAESERTISFELSENTSMQIAVLPNGNDTTFAVVTTVKTPIPDSSVEVFDHNWKPLKRQPVTSPDYKLWLTPQGEQNVDELAEVLPFFLASAEFNDDATELVFVNHSDQYLLPDDFKRVSAWVRPSIVYDVAAGKLKLRK